MMYSVEPVVYLSPSESAAVNFGETIGRLLPSRAVVLLNGPLGAGKTALVKGIVKSRTDESVSSPTFVYHQRYQAEGTPIDHVDLYRMQADQSPLGPSGVLDLAETVPGWLLIEWPLPMLRFPDDVPVITVDAQGSPDFTYRISATDPAWIAKLSERL